MAAGNGLLGARFELRQIADRQRRGEADGGVEGEILQNVAPLG